MQRQNNNTWTKNGWRDFPSRQQPIWPDNTIRDQVVDEIAHLPALVFAGESRSLKGALAEASAGNAFVLQAGDCAETFAGCHGPVIHDLLKVILQMAVILTYAGEKKVVKIGRLAGQYAKPRSSDVEVVGGVTLPSYRGDMVNSVEATPEARVPDPGRMLEGYFRATATLNLVRAFTAGGYASLESVHSWSEVNGHAISKDPLYLELADGIKKTIRFMAAIGLDYSLPQIKQVSFYTSHEALLLEYEEAMTRVDTTTGDWYDTSANMLWIGDRTRQPDGAHVEFLRGVHNPLGIKIGPTCRIDEIKRVLAKLNPGNEAGRITLITRFGNEAVSELLPKFIQEMKNEGARVVWICDPMHGNTRSLSQGLKTRRYRDVLGEIKRFWQIHNSEGSVAAGVHLELTGSPVTECLGGRNDLSENDLLLNYRTHCDPRLNADQAVELAFELASIIRPNRS